MSIKEYVHKAFIKGWTQCHATRVIREIVLKFGKVNHNFPLPGFHFIKILKSKLFIPSSRCITENKLNHDFENKSSKYFSVIDYVHLVQSIRYYSLK